MKNDEHAFRFAGEVDNFRVADHSFPIRPTRLNQAIFRNSAAIDDWTLFPRRSLPPQFVREIHQNREAGG